MAQENRGDSAETVRRRHLTRAGNKQIQLASPFTSATALLCFQPSRTNDTLIEASVPFPASTAPYRAFPLHSQHYRNSPHQVELAIPVESPIAPNWRRAARGIAHAGRKVPSPFPAGYPIRRGNSLFSEACIRNYHI